MVMCWCPHRNWASIRIHRVIRQALTGPVVPNRGSGSNQMELQGKLIWSDGSQRAWTDDSIDHMDVRLIYGTLWAPVGSQRAPTGCNRTIRFQPVTGSNNVRHGRPEPDIHAPLLAHALRNEITTCEQSPHSDIWAHGNTLRIQMSL